MGQAFKFSLGSDGIGELVFDLPGEKVNKLWLPQLEELEKILDQLATRKDIQVLVIRSGKPDVFIAGADLKSFEGAFKDRSKLENGIRLGHRVFNKIENLPFPTIAVIQGPCLGGGMELALACTYRVATDSPKTLLGLPETSLGITPGWGGTQRAPRLVGLLEGMNLILTGKPIKALKAYKIHLVDALVPAEFQDEKIAEFVASVLTESGRKKVLARRKSKGLQHWLLEANPLGRAFVYWKAEKDIRKKTQGNYPAPLLALQVIKNTHGISLKRGLEAEIKGVTQDLEKGIPVAQSLIQLFFVNEALKKENGVTEDIKPAEIHSVGVLGAGIMGSGIAWVLTNKDYPVRIKDIDLEALGKGYGAVRGLYNQALKDKRLKPFEVSNKFLKLSGTTDFTGFERMDLVIEAAVENLDLKNKLLAELEKKVPSTAIIASNTSSLGISKMAKNLKNPERFIGMHFFNPVPRMPLVEIIPGEKTSPQTIATAVNFCRKLGKTPIVVGDCAGFLVNRIFTGGANEIIRLLEQGVDRKKLDHMMLEFGYPMPPFVLADEVGNDVMYKVGKVLEDAYGDRMKVPALMQKVYDRKLLGKKVGKGFYIWNGKDKKFNPEVEQLLGTNAGKKEMAEEEMRDRVILLMINEAARCMEEKIIQRPDYLDMALIMGTGFPPFRGGLLRYADTLGTPYIVDRLKEFEKTEGSRYAPCQLLLTMSQNNRKFYP